jgi:hypothetical protein
MLTFDRNVLKATVADVLMARATRQVFRGTDTRVDRLVIDTSTAYHTPSGTKLIFSRDVGHHSSGWFKNPDFERCFHLSLSFYDPMTGISAPKNQTLTDEWIILFFGDHRRWIWCEPPAFSEGRTNDVWHYRLFADEHWQPIRPRGEVYSRELTSTGWLSYSELQAGLARGDQNAIDQVSGLRKSDGFQMG